MNAIRAEDSKPCPTDQETAMVPVIDNLNFTPDKISTLDQFKIQQMNSVKEEQQARDLLNWNDGIGTLDGCDLRFKINQLGCLELLDSDDEESENQSKTKANPNQNAISSKSNHNSSTQANVTRSAATSNGVMRFVKKARVETTPNAPIRQISPGSSLLRDGPNIRRPKSSGTSHANMLKKIEQNQNTILLEKLVPKQKLNEIRTKVDGWTSDDVEKFINSIQGCAGSGELFKSQQICGKSLLYLDQKDLLDVINVKLGPAVKIFHAISLLK